MAPKKQQRSRNGEDFKPSVSHPYTEREVELCSVHTQRHFTRLFDRAQISAYQIIVMLPVFADRQETAECEKILGSELQSAIDSMDEMLAQCEERLEATGITGKVRYTDTVTRKAAIYTPECGQFLGLLLKYDALMQLLDTLWFNRAFERDQRDEALRRANALLSDTVKSMARLQQRVIAARERFRTESRQAKEKEAVKAARKAQAREHGVESASGAAASDAPAVSNQGAGSSPESEQSGGAVRPLPQVAAADNADAIVVERPTVSAFTDESGNPRVVDSVDGEFTGEHLDDEAIAHAETEVDAAHAALVALDAKAVDEKSTKGSVRKGAARKASEAAAAAMA